MDPFRLTLLAIRVLGAWSSAIGAGWIVASASLAIGDIILTGALAPTHQSYRLAWISYALTYTVAGCIMSCFSHKIAKFVSKP